MGFVFKQSPAPQTIYNKEQVVIITISKGIKVPNVIGMQKSEASTLLSSLGFTVETTGGADSSSKIISQTPLGETFAEFGSKITIKAEDTQETTTTGTQASTTTTSSSTTSSTVSSGG
jgi:beta-lactam-binding protein with PASTA domain